MVFHSRLTKSKSLFVMRGNLALKRVTNSFGITGTEITFSLYQGHLTNVPHRLRLNLLHLEDRHSLV